MSGSVCYTYVEKEEKWTYRDAYECMLATRKQKVQTIQENSEEGRSPQFVKAKDKEICGLGERGTFIPVDPKTIGESQVLPLRWVLTIKADGTPKARLVVKGFLDGHGFLVESIGAMPASG